MQEQAAHDSFPRGLKYNFTDIFIKMNVTASIIIQNHPSMLRRTILQREEALD